MRPGWSHYDWLENGAFPKRIGQHYSNYFKLKWISAELFTQVSLGPALIQLSYNVFMYQN